MHTCRHADANMQPIAYLPAVLANICIFFAISAVCSACRLHIRNFNVGCSHVAGRCRRRCRAVYRSVAQTAGARRCYLHRFDTSTVICCCAGTYITVAYGRRRRRLLLHMWRQRRHFRDFPGISRKVAAWLGTSWLLLFYCGNSHGCYWRSCCFRVVGGLVGELVVVAFSRLSAALEPRVYVR